MPPRHRLPRVAIVGRPNVGKSTLFNRLVGRRLALVDDTPGVTRDWREGEASIGGVNFTVIDTAGLDQSAPGTLAARMAMQTEAAVRSADASLFMIDARLGVTPLDKHFGDVIRAIGKPVVLIANKAEGSAGDSGVLDAYGLGFGDPVPISAEHGEGMGDLIDAIVGHLPDRPVDADDGRTPRSLPVAVVGRPNVGKSTLINRLLGQDRLLVGPEAGITRDAIAVDWIWRDQPFRLWDTAGLRRKPRVTGKVEGLAVGDALRAIRFADVVILLIDVDQPFEKQDLQIADLIEQEGRAMVIAGNKWDLVVERRAKLTALKDQSRRLLPQIAGAPLVPVSGLTGEGTDRLLAAVITANTVWNKRVPTARLNDWLAAMVERHPPPAVSGRSIKLRYLTQTKARPPTFVVFCSRPEKLPDEYRRYLVNALRTDFGFAGVPMRLLLRRGDNPFADRRRRPRKPG
jgi:GTP-binding protein